MGAQTPSPRRLPAGLEAVHAGEHHVEDDRVVGGAPRHPQRVFAVRRDVGGEALVAQTTLEDPGHLGLILDDQDAHGLIMRVQR